MGSWYARAGDGLRWIYDRRIDAPSILNAAEDFPGAAEFVAAWQGLRAEALAVAGAMDRIPRFHEIMGEQEEISANDGRDWRMYVMKAYGTDVKANLARCPVLATLLRDHPEVVSATYSYLAPGKHIPLHRGPFRGVLRFHLGLSMPRDEHGALGATLWIDGEPHRLADGESLLWDDTYPHEVLNATDSVRIALLLDVRRPRLPADMAALSSILIGTVGMIARVRPQAFVG
ncbi:MAG: aspartyl/asparaginyl beta-hydroxylase domain-containing protein [Rhizomicrobium sp.]|jgi:aspartate beta-hydroxylase